MRKIKTHDWPDCNVCGYRNMVHKQFPFGLCGNCSFAFLDYEGEIPEYIPEAQMEMWYTEKFKRV